MGRLIDIDRLCNDLMERWSIADKEKEDTIRAVMADVVTPIVASQPTVDAVPVVHGHWKEDPSGYGFWICSACGFVSEASAADMLYKFCPACGAKMDGKDGDHHD